MAGVFCISQDNFIIVVQISRKARSIYIPKCCRMAGLVCVYKERQSLLENFPLPQFSLKYTQLGGFSAFFVFLQFSKIRHISAMHMQISPLVPFSNERSLNQFDRSLYPPPHFHCFTFTKIKDNNKCWRGSVNRFKGALEMWKGRRPRWGGWGLFNGPALRPPALSVLKPGSRSASLIRKQVF